MHHTLSLLSLCAFLVLFLFPFSWHTPKQNSKNKTPKRKMHMLSSHDTETKNGIITPRPKTRGAHQEKKQAQQTTNKHLNRWPPNEFFWAFFSFHDFFSVALSLFRPRMRTPFLSCRTSRERDYTPASTKASQTLLIAWLKASGADLKVPFGLPSSSSPFFTWRLAISPATMNQMVLNL